MREPATEAEELAAARVKTDLPQARGIGVFILEVLAASDVEALQILWVQASRDRDWPVQKFIARAFDRHGATSVVKLRFRRRYHLDSPEIAVALLCSSETTRVTILGGRG